ncbi:Tubulin-folding cofactor B [Habropoda laboriosa]|uniref:Tubulin-folding cofactor B n=1 Tax=Habropoda laboriosa TaxID=597456 RepID=A0A0L7R759_9HYME|nr:PREDICTED: tubulin-folding cofactor B [Habropoda laboriosa]KOC66710.1 Tubulin-folding cofactor B [Habropoda laboriosa]
MSVYNIKTSDFINLSITNSSQNTYCVERRFQKAITIDEFKGKLELVTGANSATMKVVVYDKNDKLICKLDEGQRLLGSYPIDDGMRIHLFMLDTVKAFLEKNKLGKYNEEEMKRKEEERKQEEEAEAAAAQLCNIGDRCEVYVPNQPKRRATIMYIGKTEFKEGWWVGVKYDEPLGKNNGM